MSVQVKLEGMAELLRNMERFPRALQRRIINGALLDSSKVITKATQSNAPRGRTGALKRSVRPTTVRAGKIGPVMLINVGVKVKRSRKKVAFTEDAFYARYVEFGTKPHIIRAFGKRLRIDGWSFPKYVKHPGARRTDFFRKAIDDNASTAMQVFVRRVRERLAQVRSASSL